ncbi:hypothetical protein GEMRC1_007904 [Eukaryota sp. GEM-RC1]
MLFKLSPSHPTKSGAICKWRCDSNMLAVSLPGSVALCDRQGSFISSISTSKDTASIDWECHGDFLSVVVPNQPNVIIYETSTSTHLTVQTTRPITCASWSPNSSLLIMGTDKGTFLQYNTQTKRLNKTIGTHQKRISSLSWSSSNLLLASSDDKTVSVTKLPSFETNRDNVVLPSPCTQLSSLSYKHKGQIVHLGAALCKGDVYSL